MTLEILDPTHERVQTGRTIAPRLDTLAGKTVGFISNGKEGTKGFFRHLERLLKETCGVARIDWQTKPNYSAPAPQGIIDSVADWDFAVTGLGD